MNYSSMVEGALQLAALGFHVLPAHSVIDSRCTCKKRSNCSSMGKHPVHNKWDEKSTTDTRTIESWWKAHPHRNVAIHCGPSNLLVVDVDFKNGAEQDYSQLVRAVPEIAEAPTVRTGSGGFHHYFRFPQTSAIGNSVGRLATGIDIRAENGIVIAPPSVNAYGAYSWIISPEGGVPETPPELVDRLLRCEPRPRTRTRAEASVTRILILPIEEGERHSTFAWLAGGLRRHGLPPEETLRLLEGIRRTDCTDPDSFPESELQSIVADLYKTVGPFSIRGYLHDWLSNLTQNQFRVAIAYYLEAAGGLSTPALKRIEEATGLSRTAILRARRELERMGAIAVRKGRFNTYSARVELRRKPQLITTY